MTLTPLISDPIDFALLILAGHFFYKHHHKQGDGKNAGKNFKGSKHP